MADEQYQDRLRGMFGGDSATAAASLLRKFEGFRSTPYYDVNAYRTGYGSDTITTASGEVVPVRQGMRVSREDAERDLQRRVQTEFMPKAASAVGAQQWGALTPAAQAGLTSVAYNYGSLPSSVVQAARTTDPNQIASAIAGLSGHNRGVNAARRQQEAAFVASGGEGFGGGIPMQTREGMRMAVPQTPQEIAGFQSIAQSSNTPEQQSDLARMFAALSPAASKTTNQQPFDANVPDEVDQIIEAIINSNQTSIG